MKFAASLAARNVSLRRRVVALVALGALVVAAALPSIAGSTLRAGHGVLVVETSPEVPSSISVNGVPRNLTAISGLELPVGEHEVSFSTVDGYLAPSPVPVTITEGETTSVVGEFSAAGTLEIITDPANLTPVVTVDGVERDRGNATLTLEVGEAKVCAEELDGYVSPACESILITHGGVSTAEFRYTLEESLTSEPELRSDPETARVIDGLVALYDFSDSSGDEIADRVGSLDLTIEDVSAVTWTSEGLRFDRPTIAVSEARVGTAIADSGELTLEAWITADNLTQRGPARIVSLADDRLEAAVLGQGNHMGDSNLIEGRIDGHGRYMDRLLTGPGSFSTDLTHVVFTRDAAGVITIYLDGEQTAVGRSRHSVAAWSADLRPSLGNRLDRERPWLGTYRLVAIYDTALDHSEVVANLAAGPDDPGVPAKAESSPSESDSKSEPVPEDEGGSGSETEGSTSQPDPDDEGGSGSETEGSTSKPDPEPQQEADAGKTAPSSWSAAWDSRDYDTIRNWYRQNTGIAAAGLSDDDLRVHEGWYNTRDHHQDGDVVENLLIRGTLNIQNDDLTVRNVKVINDGSSPAVDVSFSRGANGYVNRLTLENVSLIGTGEAAEFRQAVATSFVGLHHGQVTPNVGLRASRVYISGFGGGFRLSHYGDDRVDLSMVENIRTHPGSHNTGMSFNGGDGKSITRTWIEGSTSSALSLYPDKAPITNFTARENLFDGGTYSTWAGYLKTYKEDNHHIRYIDNLFTRNYQHGPVAGFNDSQKGSLWEGNTHLDGQPID